jgi:hypothetical protein
MKKFIGVLLLGLAIGSVNVFAKPKTKEEKKEAEWCDSTNTALKGSSNPNTELKAEYFDRCD